MPPDGAPPEERPPEERQRQTVAAFDLDGTLTRSDTFLPFLLRVAGPARVGAALAAEAKRLRRLGHDDERRHDAKEAVVGRLLAGRPAAAVDLVAEVFAAAVVARRLRPGARHRLDWHRAQGHRLVIVSASLECYVAPIGARLGVEAVLATRLEVADDGRLTGRLLGKNCRGEEKAARLSAWLPAPTPTVFAYGDSAGDDALLVLADTPVRLRGRFRAFP